MAKRAEEDDRVGDPDDGDQQVDRPFELGVFLARGPAHRQRDRGEQDDQLPAPEGELGELRQEQPRMAGALHDVVGTGEHGRAAEREDHGVGVQRAQAAVREPGQVEVQLRDQQLRRDDHADEHADDSPDDGHDRELADDTVVVVDARCDVLVDAGMRAGGDREVGAVQGSDSRGSGLAELVCSHGLVCPSAVRRRRNGGADSRILDALQEYVEHEESTRG